MRIRQQSMRACLELTAERLYSAGWPPLTDHRTMPHSPCRFSLPRAVRPRRAALLLAALLGAPAICVTAAPADTLPVVELNAGIHRIHAELADNDSARMRGLMYREALAPNQGMLFIFDETATHCMWMRNTLLPLSVAFIDNDGSIVNIEEMKARTDDTHCARRGVHYALEMAAGWYKAHGLAAGSVIKGIDKAGGGR
jgi:uncharacterized membrane protein (UPF0127 family)